MAAPYTAPSLSYWLGTDALGRSQLPMLLSGTAFTLLDVVAAASLALIIAGFVATLGSAFRSGWNRFVFGFATTFSYSTPLVAVLLLLYSIFGDHPAVFPLTAGTLLWGTAALTLQTAISNEMRSVYMQAARAQGIGRTRVLVFHLLPNLIPSVVAAWLANWPTILSVSILAAYLGAHGDSPRLGSLLKTGYELFPACWWLWLPSTLVTCLVFVLLFLALQKPLLQGAHS